MATALAAALVALGWGVLGPNGDDKKERRQVVPLANLELSMAVGNASPYSPITASTKKRAVVTRDGTKPLAFQVTVHPSRTGAVPTDAQLDVVMPGDNDNGRPTNLYPFAQVVRHRELFPAIRTQQAPVEISASRGHWPVLAKAVTGWVLQERRGNGWSDPTPIRPKLLIRPDGRHHFIELHGLAQRVADGRDLRISFLGWASRLGARLIIDAQARRAGTPVWHDWNLRLGPGDLVEVLFLVANVGNTRARDVVARASLPPGTKLVSLSGRESSSGDYSPHPVGDNIVNGGLRYRNFAAGSYAYLLYKLRIERRAWTWMKAVWLLRTRGTGEIEYYDSVRFVGPGLK